MRFRSARPLLLGTLPWASCTVTTTTTSLRCDVLLVAAEPSSGLPGAEVVLRGTPFTDVWDTAIYLDNVRAEVVDVSREGCDDCDDCRDDQECTACSDCDACDRMCELECEETATFRVPDGLSGEVWIRLFNTHGQSTRLAFTVETLPGDSNSAGDTAESGSETGGADTGAGDSGAAHSGADSGPDSGAAHTGGSGADSNI